MNLKNPHQPSDSNPSKNLFTPTVLKLGFISFFADVASEMLYPITPIFLTSILGASMTELGFIEGFAEALANLLKTYSGFWSDRISHRKPFIFLGYLLGAISKPLIGLSHTWIHVLGARGLDRTGKGIRSAPRDALLSESVESSQRGAAFGLHRSMDTLGAFLGPLLSLFLLNLNSHNLRELYFWALIPGLLSVFIIFSIKEKPAKEFKEFSPHWKHPFFIWPELQHNLKTYLLAWTVFSLTNSSDVFLLMKAKSMGLSLTHIILLYCGYNLVYALSSPYLGKLSDKIDRKKILIFGLIIFALVYLGLSTAKNLQQIALLFFIYGLYMGATDGVSKAFAIDLSPQHLKATTLGILGTFCGFATWIASILTGLIWDRFGDYWAFIYGATGAALAILILITLQSPQKSDH